MSAAEPVDLLIARAVRKTSEAVLAHKPGSRLGDHIVPEALTSNVGMPATVSPAAATGPQRLVDEALAQHDERVKAALSQAGLSSEVIELVQSLVTLHVEARMLQTQAQLGRLLQTGQGLPAAQAPALDEVPDPAADPMAPLSATELGKRLGALSDETVRLRERAGEVFSLLRPGRKRGREYPAFQAWEGIAGDPLARVLQTLGPVGGAAAYGFFSSPNPELGGLTPVEVLAGKLVKGRTLDDGAAALLREPSEARLQAVLEAAGTYAADLAA